MTASRRSKKVSGLIHGEINQLLCHKLEDPELKDVWISEVVVTPDLRLAQIFYTTPECAEGAANALERASGFMRRYLGHALKLRYVPDLKFIADDHPKIVGSLMKAFEELKAPGHA